MLGTNIGAYITSRLALTRTAFGAGQGGNPGAITGEEIQRTAKRPLHLSGKLALGFNATMASGQSMAVSGKIQHSDDGNSYTDLDGGTLASQTILANNAGGAKKGTIEWDFNIIGAKAWIQAQVTPVLTASGVSTAEIFGVYAFGGGETIPPTETNQ